ncbi:MULTISPECIES: DedA family protein [Microbacterium]|uniref:DedA family protein n=1 Tax=Microbacterium TaxID=33882 RepID=UPI0027823018|nr:MULTISPECIES: VTT domain-containing protein [Microbacterium]MDQ1083490.1 membrane-associated protein [Microbacterium sp. SORGH_AS_0344]MDQ1171231.1 membrane-associated protein [Microbacterium proteolyticum]
MDGVDTWLQAIAASPWALVGMAALVFADAFLVVVPGEAAVTAFGALAVSHEAFPLASVVLVSAAAAFAGDACCYVVGRTVGVERWAWMRGPRVRGALEWAGARLERNAAVVLFTARFVPFARLAVNLAAGAARVNPVRYLGVAALAALAWAAYQAVVGAVVAAVVPGGPVVAVVVSIVVAVGIGVGIDLMLARHARRRAAAQR